MIKRIILYLDSNFIIGENYTPEMKENIKNNNIYKDKKYQRYKNSAIDTIPTYNDELINILRKLNNNYEIVYVNEKKKEINKIINSKLNKYIANYYNNYLEACTYHKTNECILITNKYNNDIIAAKKSGIYIITIKQRKDKYIDKNINNLLEITNELIEEIDSNKIVIIKKKYNPYICQGIIVGLLLGIIILLKYRNVGIDISIGIFIGLVISLITSIILKRSN